MANNAQSVLPGSSGPADALGTGSKRSQESKVVGIVTICWLSFSYQYLGHKRLKPGLGDLKKQEPCNTSGKLIEVSRLKEAGLDFNTEVLYVRAEVVRTWEFLEARHPAAAVYGPPGIGKSIVVWAWACHLATTTNLRLCWIHKLSGDLLRVALLSENKVEWWAESSDLPDLAKITADIMIYDGAKGNTVSDILTAMRAWAELSEPSASRHVMVVSSDQTLIMLELHVKEHISYLWQRKELYDACLRDRFYEQVQHSLDNDRELIKLEEMRAEDQELENKFNEELERLSKEEDEKERVQEAKIQEMSKELQELNELKDKLNTSKARGAAKEMKSLNNRIQQKEKQMQEQQAQTQREKEERKQKLIAKQINERKQTESGKERSRRKERVNRKFYLAGGSVRWMFGFSYTEVERQIDSFIHAIPNKKDIMSGVVGGVSGQAVSHILGRNVDNEYLIQSRYIACKLALSMEAEFISLAKIPKVFHFQMEFFMQLRIACKHGQKQQFELLTTDSTVTWKVPGVVEYRDPSDLQQSNYLTTLGHKSIAKGDWLIPTRWNQACFDALQLREDSLLVVQVTQAKKHKLKLEYVVDVLAQLKAIGFGELQVEIYIVVPEASVDEFEIHQHDVRGKIPGWDLDQLKVAGLRRSNTTYNK